MGKVTAVSLNIAIIPDEEAQDLAIEMSRKINEKLGSHFTLNKKDLLPHITVYQAHFPKENAERVKNGVAKAISQIEPLIVDMDGFSISHETFLFWRCVKSERLLRLQEDVIRQTNHLRNGLILPMLSNVGNVSGEDKFDIQNYGSLLIGPHYDPHITIARIKNKDDGKNSLVLLRKQKLSFEVRELIIGYPGDHGTVNGIIEKIPLK